MCVYRVVISIHRCCRCVLSGDIDAFEYGKLTLSFGDTEGKLYTERPTRYKTGEAREIYS